jgi:hypothetical protein
VVFGRDAKKRIKVVNPPKRSSQAMKVNRTSKTLKTFGLVKLKHLSSMD